MFCVFMHVLFFVFLIIYLLIFMEISGFFVGLVCFFPCCYCISCDSTCFCCCFTCFSSHLGFGCSCNTCRGNLMVSITSVRTNLLDRWTDDSLASWFQVFACRNRLLHPHNVNSSYIQTFKTLHLSCSMIHLWLKKVNPRVKEQTENPNLSQLFDSYPGKQVWMTAALELCHMIFGSGQSRIQLLPAFNTNLFTFASHIG